MSAQPTGGARAGWDRRSQAVRLRLVVLAALVACIGIGSTAWFFVLGPEAPPPTRASRSAPPAPSPRRVLAPHSPASSLPPADPLPQYLTSPGALTAEVRKRILRKVPEAKVDAPADLTLEIEMPGGRRRTLHLFELWKEVQQYAEDGDALIRQVVETGIEGLGFTPPPPLTAAALDAGVLPVIVTQLKLDMFEPLYALSDRGEVVHEPLAGELVVAYAIPSRGFLNTKDLADAGRTVADVDRYAKRNLSRILATRLVLEREPGGVHIIRDRTLVDGVLALDEFWRRMEARVGTPIIVTFPRSMLLFAKESPGALDAMRAAVAREPPSRQGSSLPGRYLRRTQGKWEDLETPEADAPDAGRP